MTRRRTREESGRLFRSHICRLAYCDRPLPDAAAIYRFRRLFCSDRSINRLSPREATITYLPGTKTPDSECWHINMDAVDKRFSTLTTDALMRPAVR